MPQFDLSTVFKKIIDDWIQKVETLLVSLQKKSSEHSMRGHVSRQRGGVLKAPNAPGLATN